MDDRAEFCLGAAAPAAHEAKWTKPYQKSKTSQNTRQSLRTLSLLLESTLLVTEVTWEVFSNPKGNLLASHFWRVTLRIWFPPHKHPNIIFVKDNLGRL